MSERPISEAFMAIADYATGQGWGSPCNQPLHVVVVIGGKEAYKRNGPEDNPPEPLKPRQVMSTTGSGGRVPRKSTRLFRFLQAITRHKGLRCPADSASPLGVSVTTSPQLEARAAKRAAWGLGPRARRGDGATVTRVWAIAAGVVTLRGGHERATAMGC